MKGAFARAGGNLAFRKTTKKLDQLSIKRIGERFDFRRTRTPSLAQRKFPFPSVRSWRCATKDVTDILGGKAPTPVVEHHQNP
jgi:hypothetical protein